MKFNEGAIAEKTGAIGCWKDQERRDREVGWNNNESAIVSVL